MTGIVDVHCHVLPGVDDGAPDVDTSIVMLRAAWQGGTREIIATPHQDPGRYANEAAALRRAHEILLAECARLAAAGEQLPRVHLGAEIKLDGGLVEDLASGRKLVLAGGATVLLELPDVFPVRAVEELVFQLKLSSLVPLLAHPERNPQLVREPAQLERLLELGAFSQVTGSSVTGVFGTPCRRRTEDILRRGWVHVVASDAHDTRRRTADLGAARAALQALGGEELAVLLLEENPRAVLEGGLIRAPAPAPTGKGFAARLKSLLRG